MIFALKFFYTVTIRWFHCVCENISSEEYKMLSREGSGTQWHCRPCRGQVKTLKGENEKLKKNENLIMENKTLKSCLDGLEKKLNRSRRISGLKWVGM